MASIKLNYGGSIETCWSDTSKLGTCLILNDNGTLRYTPLFSGNAGQQVANGSYKYTLGHLKVGDWRAAIGRANNTYTNTVTVAYYTSTKSIYHPATSGVICGSSYSKPDYTTYHRYFYLRIPYYAFQRGSLSYMDVNSRSGHGISSGWVECCDTSSLSGYPSATATIYMCMNGSWQSKSVNFSDSEQQITFTQTGTY